MIYRGKVGDNINSAVVSFVERLSSSRRFKMYWETNYLGTLKSILCREV